MTLPANKRINHIKEIYDEILEFHEELKNIKTPLRNDVKGIREFYNKREECLKKITEKSEVLEFEKKEFLGETGIEKFNYTELNKFDSEIAEEIKKRIDKIEKYLIAMKSNIPEFINELEEFKNNINKEINTINNGQKIHRAYNPVDVSEPRFFDRKDHD